MNVTIEHERALLHNATIAYYAMDDAVMSDAEYDALFENLYGEELTPFELYQKLFVKDARKRELKRAMLSLTKARTAGEVANWIAKVRAYDADAIISLAPKYDGLACLVEVADNEIVSAITRGNGSIGEDVTYAVRNIPTPENFFAADGLYQVEVCMSTESMNELNAKRDTSKTYKHPRNAAAGVLRLSTAQTRFHAGYLSMHHHFATSAFGYQYTLDDSAEKDIESTMTHYRDEILRRMNQQSTAILTDGIVLYAHDADGNPLRYMGDDGAHPRWAIAWKFPNEGKIANLVNVHWQRGRTKNTPVATFYPPVDFDGVLVERASLHNQDQIDSLGIQIGDQVEVVRSNEVIPYVMSLHHEGEDREPIPAEPEVGEITTEMLLSLMVNVLDIRNAGAGGRRIRTIAQWMDDNYVIGEDNYAIEDIILIMADVAESPDLIEGLDRLGKKSAAALADSIAQRLAEATMVQWFACLGIPGIGRRVWSVVFDHLGGAAQIIAALESDDELKIPILGPKRESLLREHLDEIRSLTKLIEDKFGDVPGLDEAPVLDDDNTENSTGGIIVVTGKIDGVPRSAVADKISSLGWKMASSVTAETTVLFNASGRESTNTKNAEKKNVAVANINSLDEIIDCISAYE